MRKRDQRETTPELTGNDAPLLEASAGSEGNGASPWGGDLPRHHDPDVDPDMEADPGDPRDISPDKITVNPREAPPEEDEREISARPQEEPRLIPLDELAG